MASSPDNQDKKYPKGHFIGLWTGIGIAIFSGIGIPLSFITKNYGLIGIGPAIGVAFGAGIGQAMENKYEKEGKIRPLTNEEKRKQKRTIRVTIAFAILGILTLLYVIWKVV